MSVALIGAGPGDPGLLTMRGHDLLAVAEVVIYDALANPALLQFAPANAELVYVGKVASKHALPQAEINSLIASKALEGKRVARLKGGDPYIFGRGGEEAEYLAERGIDFEVVPGISSAIAAPAYAGIPLTHRDLVSSVSIITGHENPEKNESALNWKAMAESGSTLVFVMGVKNLANISRRLIEAGLEPDMPAAIIYRGTTPMQRSLFATIAELPTKAEKACFSNPSVIVVGKVASLHESLDWFSKKTLLGVRIVVTRAREQISGMAETFRQLGAEVLECPTIVIRPLDDYGTVDEAIAHLEDYDWLIFTSVNGVKYFWQRLHAAGKDSRAPGKAKIAAIGPATSDALVERGIMPDLVPDSYVAESVVAALVKREGQNLSGLRILLPRAAIARMALPEELARHGAIVDVAPLYQTQPDISSAEKLRELAREGNIDCVCFGSSSTVRNFLDFVPPELIMQHPEIILAAIGPVTAATLAGYGLKAVIQPEEYTIPALVKAVESYFASHAREGQCH